MVIVTGANGFIGSAFVGSLNSQEIPVIAVSDLVSLSERPSLLANKQFGEFFHRDQLWNFLETKNTIEKVDWVIHLGAISTTTETDWEKLYSNNFLCSQRIFEWCAKHKKNLIYASSAATYGQGELGFSDQTDPEKLKPLNLYGKSKLIFDQWVLKQSLTPPNYYGLKYFNVYGPNEYFKEDMASMVFKSFGLIKKTGQLKLFKSYNPNYADGAFVRDFIYIKDVTRWMIELMAKKPKSGIYNMGTGQAESWNTLADSLFSALKLNPNVEYVPMPDSIKNQYQYFTEADMTNWQKAGMSAPQFDVKKGVSDYVKHLNQNFEVI